jgi:DUF4097 and DUF4098 domain-containing protein YvlB
MQRFHTWSIIGLVLVGIGLGNPSGAGERTEVELSHQETIAPGGFVRVENLLGSITVTPSMDRRTLAVKARVVAEGDSVEATRELAASVRLRREEGVDGPTLHVDFPVDNYTAFRPPRSDAPGLVSRWITPLLSKSTVAAEYGGELVEVGQIRGATALAVHIEIQLPLEIRSEFQQIAGSISCTGLRGEIALESANGNLELRQIYGSLSARTGSGKLQVWKFHGESFNVQSSSGDIELNDVRAAETRLRTASGSILGDVLGGKSLLARTASGEVRLEDVQSTVLDLETGTGSVNLASHLKLLRQAAIRSESGDVTLRVSPRASFDIRTETANGSTKVKGFDLDLDEPSENGAHLVRGRKGSDLRIATVKGDVVVKPR